MLKKAVTIELFNNSFNKMRDNTTIPDNLSPLTAETILTSWRNRPHEEPDALSEAQARMQYMENHWGGSLEVVEEVKKALFHKEAQSARLNYLATSSQNIKTVKAAIEVLVEIRKTEFVVWEGESISIETWSKRSNIKLSLGRFQEMCSRYCLQLMLDVMRKEESPLSAGETENHTLCQTLLAILLQVYLQPGGLPPVSTEWVQRQKLQVATLVKRWSVYNYQMCIQKPVKDLNSDQKEKMYTMLAQVYALRSASVSVFGIEDAALLADKSATLSHMYSLKQSLGCIEEALRVFRSTTTDQCVYQDGQKYNVAEREKYWSGEYKKWQSKMFFEKLGSNSAGSSSTAAEAQASSSNGSSSFSDGSPEILIDSEGLLTKSGEIENLDHLVAALNYLLGLNASTVDEKHKLVRMYENLSDAIARLRLSLNENQKSLLDPKELIFLANRFRLLNSIAFKIDMTKQPELKFSYAASIVDVLKRIVSFLESGTEVDLPDDIHRYKGYLKDYSEVLMESNPDRAASKRPRSVQDYSERNKRRQNAPRAGGHRRQTAGNSAQEPLPQQECEHAQLGSSSSSSTSSLSLLAKTAVVSEPPLEMTDSRTSGAQVFQELSSQVVEGSQDQVLKQAVTPNQSEDFQQEISEPGSSSNQQRLGGASLFQAQAKDVPSSASLGFSSGRSSGPQPQYAGESGDYRSMPERTRGRSIKNPFDCLLKLRGEGVSVSSRAPYVLHLGCVSLKEDEIENFCKENTSLVNKVLNYHGVSPLIAALQCMDCSKFEDYDNDQLTLYKQFIMSLIYVSTLETLQMATVAQSKIGGNKGDTALAWSVYLDSDSIFNALLARGARPQKSQCKEVSCMHNLLPDSESALSIRENYTLAMFWSILQYCESIEILEYELAELPIRKFEAVDFFVECITAYRLIMLYIHKANGRKQASNILANELITALDSGRFSLNHWNKLEHKSETLCASALREGFKGLCSYADTAEDEKRSLKVLQGKASMIAQNFLEPTDYDLYFGYGNESTARMRF